MTNIPRESEPDPFEHFVYVIAVKRFYDMRTLVSYDLEQFAALHGSQRKDLNAHSDFLSGAGRCVDQVTYKPGGDFLVTDDDGLALNLYRPTSLTPTTGDVGPWLDLWFHVVPDEAARAHLLNWCADLVQHPDRKVNHQIMIGGKQGIGKDSLLQPIIAAVGASNTVVIGPNDLAGQFNDWAEAKLLAVVEEVEAFHRPTFANKVKPLFAAPPHDIRINRKHVPAFAVPNLLRFVLFTNSPTPIAIDADDRRVFFYYSPATKKPSAYYRAYHAWCARHAGSVLRYLQSRDLSNFNRYDAPPATAAKDAL